MTDMKFYYYDSSFYVAVVSDIFMAFDFHDAVPAEFYRDFPREKVASFRKKYFFTSHIHADHFEPTVFKYAGEGVKFILDEAIPAEESERILRVKKGDTYTDEDLTVHVFGSTDEGVSFGVEVAGKKIFHAGDLNLWHWTKENSKKEEAAAREFFESEFSYVKENFMAPDVAMFPVDSRMKGDYAEGAKRCAKELMPKLFLPMHFWGDFKAAKDFAALDLGDVKVAAPEAFGEIKL